MTILTKNNKICLKSVYEDYNLILRISTQIIELNLGNISKNTLKKEK